MVDIKKHKLIMLQILKDIYADVEIGSVLGFKGDTALMFFHELPRFSVDLDFDLLEKEKEQQLFDKIRQILAKYGKIKDEARKHFGILLLMNYEFEARNLKVEISNRQYPNNYELKDYLGISVKVMKIEDMFAHKLVALLERNMLASRDVFDCWFLMNKRIMPNREILNARLDCSFNDYLDRCCDKVQEINQNQILYGMGEVLDNDLKKWVKANLIKEFVALAQFYKELTA